MCGPAAASTIPGHLPCLSLLPRKPLIPLRLHPFPALAGAPPLLAWLQLAPAPALAVPDGGVELVSRPSGFGPLPFDGVDYAVTTPHAMTGDGCKVVLQSGNDVL